jgi:hypothetical protein
MTQIAGFDEGNGAKDAYQFTIGGAFSGFSIDGVYSHADNAIALATWAPTSAGLPTNWSANDLTGTYANLDAFQLLAKYTYQQFTLSGGYQNSRFSNPDAADAKWDKTNAVTAQGDGYVVDPAVFIKVAGVTTNSYNVTAYTINKILQVEWVGAKYSVLPNLDLEGGYWYVTQNDYDTAPATNCVTGYTISGTGKGTGYAAVPGQGTKKSDCAGNEDAVSFVIDYRPFKRVDTYAGIMYSKVSGGLASGYAESNNTAFTAGVRLSF